MNNRIKFNQQIDKSQKSFSIAKTNLLLIAVLTSVNIAFLFLGEDTYFLFSASIPYILTSLSMYLCGMFPEDFYEGGYEAYNFYGREIFGIALAISIVIIAVYFALCFLMKKKKKIWLVVSLVVFAIDTIVMFLYYGINISMIIDILFHIYLLVSLSIGIYSVGKPKNEDEIRDDTEDIESEDSSNTEEAEIENSVRLRLADTMVKSKTLLEAEALGHKIVYRRVNRVNELVIDGSVYSEYEALFERAHELTAIIDGHCISAGLDSRTCRSYIEVDGQIVKSKVRLI